MKVLLVAFQTPQADSFCHSWPMTSSRASGRFSSRRRGAGGAGAERVGVAERERLVTGRWRRGGERAGEGPGEYGEGGASLRRAGGVWA